MPSVTSPTASASDSVAEQVADGSVHLPGRAQLARPVQRVVPEVGHGDRARALEPGHHLDQGSHESRANDHYVVGERRGGQFHGVDHAGQRLGDRREGHVRGHRHAEAFLDDGLLGEPATGHPGSDPLPWCEARHPWPGLLDDPGDLVPDPRGQRGRIPARPEVQFRRADPALQDAQPRLARANRRHLGVDEFDRARSGQNGSLHGQPPRFCGPVAAAVTVTAGHPW